MKDAGAQRCFHVVSGQELADWLESRVSVWPSRAVAGLKWFWRPGGPCPAPEFILLRDSNTGARRDAARSISGQWPSLTQAGDSAPPDKRLARALACLRSPCSTVCQWHKQRSGRAQIYEALIMSTSSQKTLVGCGAFASWTRWSALNTLRLPCSGFTVMLAGSWASTCASTSRVHFFSLQRRKEAVVSFVKFPFCLLCFVTQTYIVCKWNGMIARTLPPSCSIHTPHLFSSAERNPIDPKYLARSTEVITVRSSSLGGAPSPPKHQTSDSALCKPASRLSQQVSNYSAPRIAASSIAIVSDRRAGRRNAWTPWRCC